MDSDIIRRVRRLVRDRRYRFTDHALEEADADGLRQSEVVSVLLIGEIEAVYTDDLRGTRYVVRGDVRGLEVDVVCRIQEDDILLIIITVYVVNGV